MIKDILLAASGQQEQFFKPIGSAGTWVSVDCNYSGQIVVTCNDTYSSTNQLQRSQDGGSTWSAVSMGSLLSGSSRQFYNVKCNHDGLRYCCGSKFFISGTKYGWLWLDGTGGVIETYGTTLSTPLATGAHGTSDANQKSLRHVFNEDPGKVTFNGSVITTYVNTPYIYRGDITKQNGDRAIFASVGLGGSGGILRYCSDMTISPPTFVTLTSAGTRLFYDARVSSDGVKIATVVYGDGVYVSIDSGASFSKKTSGSTNVHKMAMSYSGSVIVALADSPARLLISKDTGTTWIEKVLPVNAGAEVCLSSDGTVGYVATGAANDFIYKFNP